MSGVEESDEVLLRPEYMKAVPGIGMSNVDERIQEER